MTPVITAIITFVSSVLTGGITFFFARRKNRAQAVAMELDNAKEVIGIWRELSKEQDKKIEELEGEVKALRKALDELGSKYREQCVSCIYRLAYEDKS